MGGRSNANKKNILIVLGVVIVLLVVSVSILMNSRRTRAVREEYRIQLEELNQDLHVANTKGYANDKETANSILDKVDYVCTGGGAMLEFLAGKKVPGLEALR